MSRIGGAMAAGVAALLLLTPQVHAHGIADGLAVYPQGASGGTYYRGYNPSMQFETPPPDVVGWSVPDDLQNTFIPPNQYSNPDIICHLGATPAALAVPVNGGDDIGIHWDTWPDSHKGPITDSLANCNGPCQDVDKTTLKFFDISREAVLDAQADLWAPNLLIRNNLTWFVTIPDTLEPGNYVLRHEIVALHAAGQPNGAQNYPFCFNLAVSSTGSDSPEGLGVQAYYESDQAGIVWDLFGKKPQDYPIPGPAGNLYSGAIKATQRQPTITATGTAVTSLDPASLPAQSSEEVVESEQEETSVAEETSIVETELPSLSEVPGPEITASTEVTSVTEETEVQATSTAAEEDAEEREEVRTSNGVVYSTVFVTERVTITERETITVFATVTLPSP